MATIDIDAGGVMYGGVPVELFSKDGSPLEHWVWAHLERSPGLPLKLSSDRVVGTLFKYVLCFLEDPDGFVPPTKDRDNVIGQLSYFGLVDANTSLKTRLDMEHAIAEHAADAERHAADAERHAKTRWMLGRMTYLVCVMNTGNSRAFNRGEFVATVSGSDLDFVGNFGWLRSTLGKTEEERVANAGICREALQQHPESYGAPLHSLI